MAKLAEYKKKRKFSATPEPQGTEERGGGHIFVVQRHDATRLHYDFRLEVDGVLKSWAVPKGPPMEPNEKRLAVHVEDHPVEYAKFAGQIPKGNYGAGEVRIWDHGTFEPEGPGSASEQIKNGEIKFRLFGERLKGSYVLVKMKNSAKQNEWLFIRHKDRLPGEEVKPSGGPVQVYGAAPVYPPPKPASANAAKNAKAVGTSKATAAKKEEAKKLPRPKGRRGTWMDGQADTEELALIDPSTLPGAVEAVMPRSVDAALALLGDKPFSDPNWLFEIKWDGQRTLAFLSKGDVELRSRTHRSVTHQFPEFHSLARSVRAIEAILDGEIVVLDESGRSDFQKLQNRFIGSTPSVAMREQYPVTYYFFDILYCDGYDLRKVPLIERKKLLQSVLRPSSTLRFSDHQLEHGKELYELASAQQLEGILAKEIHSPYVGKRTRFWIKLKIVQEVDTVVGGWTEPRNSRDYFGALLVGLYDGEKLEYVASVGTGFPHEVLKETYEKLQAVKSKECPFATRPKVKEKATWVRPELVARVKYGMWTDDRKLRAPVFIGFRDDVGPEDCKFESEVPKEAVKEARKVDVKEAGRVETGAGEMKGREQKAQRPPKLPKQNERGGARLSVVPKAPKRGPDERGSAKDAEALSETILKAKGAALVIEVDGREVKFSNLDKVYFPEAGYKKRDVLAYYARMAPYIVPVLEGRPMVLRRYPDGIHGEAFFQKEAPSPRPAWMETVMIDSKERGGKMPYVLCNDAAALLFLTNLGCIDHNPWSSRADNQEHPDYIFFDLDPTDEAPYSAVLKIAAAISRELERAGMKAYPKTSGATGFHIFIPLEARYTYEQVRQFADVIAQMVSHELPQLTTLERTVSKRPQGKVLIDTLQNAKGKPLACAYSLRPFPKAPVSTPMLESELEKNFSADTWNLKTVPGRLKKLGNLWGDFFDNRQRLEDAVARMSEGRAREASPRKRGKR